MSNPTTYRYAFRAMGGPCDLTLTGVAQPPGALAAALEAEVRRLERTYSRFDPDSLVSRINREGVAGIELDPEAAGLIDFADQCHRDSDGLFDITTGVLRRVWDFRSGVLPEPEAVAAILARVGWSRVEWRNPVLTMPEGMELDLGGLVKEFAADRLLALLVEAGVSGLVNLAGDIRVTGPRPDGRPWPVGVSHPRAPGRAAATLDLYAGGLATSGDYERYLTVAGRRYCHILHPATGWPVPDGPASVSVVADSCLLAGALTTMAMLKGKDAESWLAALGVPYLLFDKDLTLCGTGIDPVSGAPEETEVP